MQTPTHLLSTKETGSSFERDSLKSHAACGCHSLRGSFAATGKQSAAQVTTSSVEGVSGDASNKLGARANESFKAVSAEA